MVSKTRCTDTIYSIVTAENIKNAFLSYINPGTKNKTAEKLDPDTFKERQRKYDRTHSCRVAYKGFEFPRQSTIYLKLMYLNSKCDSVPVMEGDFYQNQKYEFYYCGSYKEYDQNGLVKTEGNYVFTRNGQRSVNILQDGVIQYGEIPREYKNEEYGGAFMKAKKYGTWKYYRNGKLIKTESFKS